MANQTLNGWKASIAIGVVEAVPLQDFDSALVMVDDYLSSTGGWVPDDPMDATGPGVPASGVSNEEAIILIQQRQLDRVYHMTVTGTLEFSIQMNENLPSGLTDEDVLLQIATRLDEVVEANLSRTQITFNSITDYTGTVTNGPTTTAQRVAIQNTIIGGGHITDPNAIGLSAARATWNLDPTFNVNYLYTVPSKTLYLLIVKYTNTTYSTIDANAPKQYGITLDAISYRVTGGTILSV